MVMAQGETFLYNQIEMKPPSITLLYQYTKLKQVHELKIYNCD